MLTKLESRETEKCDVHVTSLADRIYNVRQVFIFSRLVRTRHSIVLLFGTRPHTYAFLLIPLSVLVYSFAYYYYLYMFFTVYTMTMNVTK